MTLNRPNYRLGETYPYGALGAQYRYRHRPIELLAKILVEKWYDFILGSKLYILGFWAPYGPFGGQYVLFGHPIGPQGQYMYRYTYTPGAET